MLGIVWAWFCTIGQLLFIALFIIGIICSIRDKSLQFPKKFEAKHPKLAQWIYAVLIVWMFIGVMAAMSHVHVTIS